MKVRFIKINSEGNQEEAGLAILEDGEVFFQNTPPAIDLMSHQFGISSGGERLFPEDGEKFLKALPIQYSGSRFRAELIEE